MGSRHPRHLHESSTGDGRSVALTISHIEIQHLDRESSVTATEAFTIPPPPSTGGGEAAPLRHRLGALRTAAAPGTALPSAPGRRQGHGGHPPAPRQTHSPPRNAFSDSQRPSTVARRVSGHAGPPQTSRVFCRDVGLDR